MGDSRWQDIRYAVRTLRRARGASLLIVATLAVVIAATTSILTVANRLLLRPAPRDRDPEGARSGARDPRVALWPQSGPSTFGGVVALMLAIHWTG